MFCTSYHSHGGKQHWKRHAKRRWKNRFGANWGYPPVNVEELDDKYEIQVYAAGYQKNDFSLSLQDKILVVSARKAETEEEEGKSWRRKEYTPGRFERHFELNSKIDVEAISAKYENGVLTVTLPKLSGFETKRQEIEIS